MHHVTSYPRYAYMVTEATIECSMNMYIRPDYTVILSDNIISRVMIFTMQVGSSH